MKNGTTNTHRTSRGSPLIALRDPIPNVVTHLKASYQIAGYLLGVGAQNLFDVFPDRTPPSTRSTVSRHFRASRRSA